MFEWDEWKGESNRRKHGVSFEEAKSVFADVSALLIDDPDHSVSEQRFLLLGFSSQARILVVAHCVRGGGKVVRVISSRKATKNEVGQYLDRRRRGSDPDA